MEAMQTPAIALQLSHITKTCMVLLQPVIRFGWGFPLASHWNEIENYPDVYLKVLRRLLCMLKGEVDSFFKLNMDNKKKNLCRLISLKVYLIHFCEIHCDFYVIFFLDKSEFIKPILFLWNTK